MLYCLGYNKKEKGLHLFSIGTGLFVYYNIFDLQLVVFMDAEPMNTEG